MRHVRYLAAVVMVAGVCGPTASARAQEVLVEENPGELVAAEAPPPLQRETIVIRERPSARHVWIHGHWAWRGRWIWVPGHWHLQKVGHHFVGGHWEARDGRFHWIAGGWIEEAKLTEESPGLLEATMAPPAPQQETILIETRPSPNHVWMHGHWAWHGHWVWVHGHWHPGRAGNNWIKGHWFARDGRWHWEAGRWLAEQQVTEERPGLLVATGMPPAPYQETVLIETRPSPNHIWIHGHWAWHGHWVWEHGHWHANNPGHQYVQGRWVEAGGQWHWTEGSWIEEARMTEERPGLVVASTAPPPPMTETILMETRPSPNHVWIGGHWSWHGHWVWEHGHWHPQTVGHTWVGGTWEAKGGAYHWHAGSWHK
jgi:hypothetical protein